MWTERLKAIVCMYIVHCRVIVDNEGEFQFVFPIFLKYLQYIYILIVKNDLKLN